MDTTIELYRCRACNRLITWGQISDAEGCPHCKSREIRGGIPSGIFEKSLVGYWWLMLTIRIKMEELIKWIENLRQSKSEQKMDQ
jgi:DNA-directed RNA polymerase subunit RPC12/RpoP